ncbi:MAG TPA: DUF1206 domain-containing protein [Actinophytocola sp.]|uniref:DUF1206 domain-containing protein n=1 Tax=Actinophytocola sp. TaxID=1872138 RepID=UPI002DDCD55E|nr:DUF1206 domain-containing protein [Actinophytocola sp.]HEV2783321.1 DUF1206 domain-containing protein [Actinophytocola sp.]
MVRTAQRSTPIAVLGRAGMVCYGVVHLIVAYLGVQIAVAGNGQSADKSGAVEEIASTSFGGMLLWVLAIGLFAFALWQVLLAIVGYGWRHKKRTRVFKRIGAAVRAVIAVSIGVTAVRVASGAGSAGDGDQQQQNFTAKVLELPAGRILVGLAALIVLCYGIAAVSSGVRRSFMKDLNTSELPAGSQQWVRRLGMIGYIGKGVAIGIVAILLGLAAFRSNPNEAGGLDAALRTLADQPFGTFLLIAVALGFAGYGVYCFAAARSHRTA